MTIKELKKLIDTSAKEVYKDVFDKKALTKLTEQIDLEAREKFYEYRDLYNKQRSRTLDLILLVMGDERCSVEMPKFKSNHEKFNWLKSFFLPEPMQDLVDYNSKK